MAKRISSKQLIEAAKKNGYQLSRGEWFTDSHGYPVRTGSEDDPIISACFMGQMAINLGVNFSSLYGALNEHYSSLGYNIMHWNDVMRLDYDDMLKIFEIRISSEGYKRFNLLEHIYYAKRKED